VPFWPNEGRVLAELAWLVVPTPLPEEDADEGVECGGEVALVAPPVPAEATGCWTGAALTGVVGVGEVSVADTACELADEGEVEPAAAATDPVPCCAVGSVPAGRCTRGRRRPAVVARPRSARFIVRVGAVAFRRTWVGDGATAIAPMARATSIAPIGAPPAAAILDEFEFPASLCATDGDETIPTSTIAAPARAIITKAATTAPPDRTRRRHNRVLCPTGTTSGSDAHGSLSGPRSAA
jgi:hypothetical protein